MLANINLLEYIDLILDWGSSSCLSPAKKKRLQLNKKYCYIAGNFFPTARALIGYFEVTWHMTSNNENVSCQNLWAGNVAKSMTSEGNSAHVVLTDDCSCSEVLWIFSFKISPQATLRFSGNKINCFPPDQSIFTCLLLWSRRLPSSRKQESLSMKENPPTELLFVCN